MTEQEFKSRTKRFALDIIRFVRNLPRGLVEDVISRQLVRSGTSVGANYRAACRGRSTADVIAKLRIVEEEGDEAMYWLELLEEDQIVDRAVLAPLLREADEIVAMTVASIKTMQSRLENQRR
jgi:four helix bundle protein